MSSVLQIILLQKRRCHNKSSVQNHCHTVAAFRGRLPKSMIQTFGITYKYLPICRLPHENLLFLSTMSTVESKLVSPPEVREWPYSVFSRKEKWFIVSLVSLAGMFRWVSLFTYLNSTMLDDDPLNSLAHLPPTSIFQLSQPLYLHFTSPPK